MTSSDPISLLIFGDVCPTSDTRALFDSGVPEALFGSLLNKIRSADLAIANLECVLSETARPAEKIGPVLTGRPGDAELLAAAGFDLLGCANNHIKDCGATGVLDTLKACKDAGVRTVGGGSNAVSAAEPARVKINGWTIGVLAVAEHEFNAAKPDSAGAHIFDPLVDLERLRMLKAECDYVIVTYHGGIEYHPYPSPLLQKTCRSIVRNGADLVLCQHSHVIGTFESYNGGHILYGQGNSVYGYRESRPSWNQGLAVAVTLECREAVQASVELLPIGCDATGRVDLLPPDAARSCLEALTLRSRRAEDSLWIEAAWARFCLNQGKNHLPHVLGLGLWLTRLNRLLRGGVVRALFSRNQRMIAMNVVRCDAHREVVLKALAQTLDGHSQDAALP